MKDKRICYIKDLEVMIRFDHRHFETDKFKNLHHACPIPEKVVFNFEIYYDFNPITYDESLFSNSIYEYTTIIAKVKKFSENIQTCVIEYLLDNVVDHIMQDERITHVKAELLRPEVQDFVKIGVGLEKNRN